VIGVVAVEELLDGDGRSTDGQCVDGRIGRVPGALGGGAPVGFLAAPLRKVCSAYSATA